MASGPFWLASQGLLGLPMSKRVREAEQAAIDEDLQQIVKLLQKKGPMSPHEIRMELQLSRHQWRLRYGRLLGAGLIEPEMNKRVVKTATGRYVLRA